MLFLIEAKQGHEAWKPWYDKSFGFVIEAMSSHEARSIASENCNDEGAEVWLDPTASDCVLIAIESEVMDRGVVLEDFRSA